MQRCPQVGDQEPQFHGVASCRRLQLSGASVHPQLSVTITTIININERDFMVAG